ncbi:unnamed protein product [Leuciscus chuanchicus]
MRKKVGKMEVKVCHVDVATEMVEINGANVETQICYIQDSSGHMKLQLCAGQIGLVKWLEQVPSYTLKLREEVVTTLIGIIIRAEIAVSKKCTKCQAWQPDFNAALKFHRCQRCKFLQKAEFYQCTASGRVALLQEGREMDLSVTNSAIRRYLEKEAITHLLIEGQNVEEHLLSGDAWKVQIQHDVVVGLDKVVETAESGEIEDQELAGAMAAMEGEQI